MSPRPASLDQVVIVRPSSPSSAASSSPRDQPLSSPPTIATFHPSTHAGGILPSASFFHPSRPTRSSPSPSPSARSHPIPSQHDSDSHPLATHSKRSQEPLLSDTPPQSRFCSGISPLSHNPSLDSTRDLIPLSTPRKSFHRPHSAQLSPSIPTPSVFHVRTPSSRPPSSSPSPNNVFVSDPPKVFPPLSAVPLVPHTRVYQLYPSRNRFFCAGRLLTGGDSPYAFIASLALVIAISATWFSTTCVWWWQNESPAVAAVGAYMTLLTISCMLATAFRDPGILPRDLDPDPPLPATSPSDGAVRVPLPRDLRIRSDTVRVKYCLTCKTYRPPRSSHCRMCDNCVDDCDHHCQWVNNCVGRRNYTFFFSFLFSAVLTLCLVICTSALHLYILTQRDHVDFRHALSHGVGSAIAFVLSILVVWPVTALLAYHMRLLLLNITTIEQIRNQAHKTLVPGAPPPNPFSYGSWRTNLAEILCRPSGFSWLNARAIVTEDKRQVNPGLDDARWNDDDLEQVRRTDDV